MRKIEKRKTKEKMRKSRSFFCLLTIFYFYDIFRHSLPITTNLDNLKKKIMMARNNIHVDVAFFGGITNDNHVELIKLANNGIVGFKTILSPQEFEEFSHLSIEKLGSVMEIIEETGLPLVVSLTVIF